MLFISLLFAYRIFFACPCAILRLSHEINPSPSNPLVAHRTDHVPPQLLDRGTTLFRLDEQIYKFKA